MRRLSDRARLEGMLALRKALETVRRGQPKPPQLAVAPEPDAPTWWQQPDELPDASIPGVRSVAPFDTNGVGLERAFGRIADAIDRIAAQLDSYHVERVQHLDAIEFLLREIVIGTVQPTGAGAVVLGGVIGPFEDPADDISIVSDGMPLAVNCAVEVRSRFHDRWISGFTIAEAVDEPGRLRYRLTRRSDGIPLPILFDAWDVRSATATEREPLPPARRDTRSRA